MISKLLFSKSRFEILARFFEGRLEIGMSFIKGGFSRGNDPIRGFSQGVNRLAIRVELLARIAKKVLGSL